MTGVLRVLRKDLTEFLDGIRGIVLVLVLPPLALLFVGQLNVTAAPVRLLVVTADAGTAARLAQRGLDEASPFVLARRELPAMQDPLALLAESGVDLLLDATAAESDRWELYTRATDPARLAVLRQLAPVAFAGTSPGAGQGLRAYFPQAADPRLNLLPAAMMLVLCLVPFVVAAPALIGERESHTLDVLLATRGIGCARLFAGKALLPVVLAFFDLAVMLVLVQLVHGMQVKSGLLAAAALLVPAVLASTFLGLAVSALARSQAQAMLSASIYFLVLLLFSGFVYPLENSAPLVRQAAMLLPLTHILAPFRAWMFGAWSTVAWMPPAGWLVTEALAYGLLAALAFRRMRRRL